MSALLRAGLTPDLLHEIDHLLIGCGGFVRELVTHTAGASTLKDEGGQRLSAADCLVDRLVTRELQCLLPDSSGYSEEGGAFGEVRPGLHVRWLLDPVDGTRPALLGGAFGISLGALVLEGEEPVASLGWVYTPALGVLYRGIWSAEQRECLRNSDAASVEQELDDAALRRSYLAVNSDWRSSLLERSPLKLSAPGATSIHLTQLVHPRSDVVAVALTRYKPYDAAGGLVVAVAGGCALYPLEAERRQVPAPVDLLAHLSAGYSEPEAAGSPLLICAPAVARALL